MTTKINQEIHENKSKAKAAIKSLYLGSLDCKEKLKKIVAETHLFMNPKENMKVGFKELETNA